MDKQEYLGFVEILKQTRRSIQEANEVLLVNASAARSQLEPAMAELDKAIMAYKEKANAPRS
jgi:hypothetical protein